MSDMFMSCILNQDNNPVEGSVSFDTSDHVRYQNGQDVSGHNYGCNRRFVIEKNINGNEGYTVTLYNLDGLHPVWQDNVQMAPKQMKIVTKSGNIIEFRGFGHDRHGTPFNTYGILIMVENNEIVKMQLNMFDRNTNILYYK